MKHKILKSLDEHSSGPEVFAELRSLLNETHEKFLTGLRLQDYFEMKLAPVGAQAGTRLKSMLNGLQYAVDMEGEAKGQGMQFEMHRGKLEDYSLRHMSAVADLMIIDRKTLAPFCGEDVLGQLMQSLYCPVLVLPETRDIESLVMVFDGSFSSIQAVKSFVTVFHPSFRELPFNLLVQDPESQKAMQKERVFIDYLKMFFKDIGVQLMDDDTIECLDRVIGRTSEKPLLLFGGNTGKEVLKCNLDARYIADNNPSFIYKGGEA